MVRNEMRFSSAFTSRVFGFSATNYWPDALPSLLNSCFSFHRPAQLHRHNGTTPPKSQNWQMCASPSSLLHKLNPKSLHERLTVAEFLWTPSSYPRTHSRAIKFNLTRLCTFLQIFVNLFFAEDSFRYFWSLTTVLNVVEVLQLTQRLISTIETVNESSF